MGDCNSLGDCDDTRIERLYEYLDGALSKEDLNDVKRHLEHCSECAQEYDLECIIRSVVRRSCTDTAPQTLKSRIMLRISEIRIEVGHG
ncbi:hypothetical protein GCM10022377_00930 [Zhihengliuella alba]|uniref:Putative zinc-finger domain-containing protein n=1 Tax=Zhihengliuella alba TaxID=547018 RepID=A0ABP7CL94_9MICC